MVWVWLGVAGLFEAVWAVLLKYTGGFSRLLPSLATVAAMAVEGDPATTARIFCLALILGGVAGLKLAN